MYKKIIFALIFIFGIVVSLYFGFSSYLSKNVSVEFNGLQRSYRIHVPKVYDGSNAVPLVIALHGYADSPRLIEMYSNLSRKAEEENFIVVYPKGTAGEGVEPLSFNANICCGYAQKHKIDDVSYVNFLIDKISKEYNIDSKKIYVTGMSNGGMLAHLVGLKLSHKVAAIAPVSATVGSKISEINSYFTYFQNTYSPVPVIMFHGREDTKVPFDGGLGARNFYEFPSFYDSLDFWLTNNECQKRPETISDQPKYKYERFTNCKDGVSVEYYAVSGRHVWPGTFTRLIRGLQTKHIDATEMMWDFFKNNPKSN